MAVVAGASVSLAACVHYTPAPPHPEQFPAQLDSRRLDEKPAGAEWSGADLLAAALARNPAVTEARAKYQTAVRAIRTAKVPPSGTLTLTGEYSKAAGPNIWGHSGGSDIPLDLGGRRKARITMAELQALQSLYDYGEAAWMVRTALAKARAELVAADTELALADHVVGLRRDRALRLERRVAAGEDTRFVQLAAQTELVNAERRLADARARHVQAQVALAKALGVSPAAVRELRFAPPSPPLPLLTDLPAWRLDAALSRRDVLRAIADYDLAENALRLEVAKQYPDVHIGPAYNYDHGVMKLPFNLPIALPPMDLNRAAIRQAESARFAAGRALENTQANALATVDQAAAALAAARANAERARNVDLPMAQRTERNAARSLQAGETDRVDELQARAAEGEAELALLDAERFYRISVADLEDALRRPFDPAETAVFQAAINQPGGAR